MSPEPSSPEPGTLWSVEPGVESAVEGLVDGTEEEKMLLKVLKLSSPVSSPHATIMNHRERISRVVSTRPKMFFFM